jgi:hypothetical protein
MDWAILQGAPVHRTEVVCEHLTSADSSRRLMHRAMLHVPRSSQVSNFKDVNVQVAVLNGMER